MRMHEEEEGAGRGGGGGGGGGERGGYLVNRFTYRCMCWFVSGRTRGREGRADRLVSVSGGVSGWTGGRLSCGLLTGDGLEHRAHRGPLRRLVRGLVRRGSRRGADGSF